VLAPEGAEVFQLDDGGGALAKADGIDEDGSGDASGLGAKTAVVGGWVVFASVLRGGNTLKGLGVVKGLSKRKPVPVFGGRNEGRGLAESSESSSCAGRGEGGGFKGIGPSTLFSGCP
jgi:hypothetical protein